MSSSAWCFRRPAYLGGFGWFLAPRWYYETESARQADGRYESLTESEPGFEEFWILLLESGQTLFDASPSEHTLTP